MRTYETDLCGLQCWTQIRHKIHKGTHTKVHRHFNKGKTGLFIHRELTGSDKQVRKEIQVTKSECTSGKGRQEEKLTQNIKETNPQSKTGNDRKRQTKKNFKETQMG